MEFDSRVAIEIYVRKWRKSESGAEMAIFDILGEATFLGLATAVVERHGAEERGAREFWCVIVPACHVSRTEERSSKGSRRVQGLSLSCF